MGTTVPPWALGLWVCSPSGDFVGAGDCCAPAAGAGVAAPGEELEDCSLQPVTKTSAATAVAARTDHNVRIISTPFQGQPGADCALGWLLEGEPAGIGPHKRGPTCPLCGQYRLRTLLQSQGRTVN